MPGPLDGRNRQHESAGRVSFSVAYDLWLRGWEAALSAIATATQGRMLNAAEAAAHKAVIAVERELVRQHFAQLLGDAPSPSRVSDAISMAAAAERGDVR